MIQIDWQQIIAWLLLGGSGIGGLIWGGKTAWTKFRSGRPAVTTERSADEPPPPGAVEWLVDIFGHMGDASPESKVTAAIKGLTRAQAQQMRITELEAKP